MRELRARVTDLENKLGAKEEELKNNKIELVAWTEKYEQVQAEVRLLKGKLARLHADNKSRKTQLNKAKEEARIAVAKVIYEYQSLVEMAALRQTVRDQAFQEAVESFAYTTIVQHLNWDLSYLGDHLATQISEWRAQLPVEQTSAKDRPATPILQVEEVQEVPVLLPDSLLEQVIEGNQEPAIWPVENNASIEQVDNPDGIVHRQE